MFFSIETIAYVLRIMTFAAMLIMLISTFKLFHFWWIFFPAFERRYSLNKVLYILGEVGRGQKVNILGSLAAEYFGKMSYGYRNCLKHAKASNDVYYLASKKLVEEKQINETDLKYLYHYVSTRIYGGFVLLFLMCIVVIQEFWFPIFPT